MLKLGVNEHNEIIAYGEEIPEGLTIIEVDEDTFADKNPLLFKIQAGENWQMIYPRVKVQAWAAGLEFKKGGIIAFEGGLFEVIEDHISRGKNDFTPDVAPGLFKTTLPDQVKQYGRKP